MSLLQNSNAISSGGYDINNSLRFRSSASATLSKTLATPTLNTKWTWSAWVKLGTIGADQDFFVGGSSPNGGLIYLRTVSGAGTLAFYQGASGNSIDCYSVDVLRDPSAWYHLVVAVDLSQTTNANKVKFYKNGTQMSATYNTPTITTSVINSATSHSIGGNWTGYFDGYLAEVNFVDGQALTPSSFGETDTTTGSWKPKAYSGTYGTNGFYLKFSDIATTSGSNAGLGKDFSGNTNYWTTNNISVTAGVTYDAMTDSPTLTSATVANYATLNPLLQNSWWAAVNRGTITNGNLTHSSGGNTTAFGNFDLVGNSGKWYYEMTCGATDTNNALVIAAQSRSTFEVGYYQSGLKQINGATPNSYGSSWTSGDVIGVAIDVPNNNITFYKNNTSQGVINNAFPTGQPVYGGSYYNSTSGDYHYNFGQRPFSYTPPSGYVAMNTYNLPDSTIKKGNSYMDATLWTGDGATTRSITNASSFKPDLIWIKGRSSTGSHLLQDSNRGFGTATKLSTNSTNAENNASADATDPIYGYITAANSNGFSVNVGTTPAQTNNNGVAFVAWQWQSGQGSTSSNTSGSITSTVSVNATAGFSIVTYTGNGTAGATVGHGLGVAPVFVIWKNRSVAGTAWLVQGNNIGNPTDGWHLTLHTSNQRFQSTDNNNTFGSTTITLDYADSQNGNGNSMVAYCWAEIAGFSKFGSYTGNGSADGTFVYTGFRPRFLIWKRTDSTSNWWMVDTARVPYNTSSYLLFANLFNQEYQGGGFDYDILANGFKFRNGDSTGYNGSGASFIYMAFAENPFKNANAR